MALYTEAFIRRVRDANDLPQVVESYQVPLRRVGSGLVGLCPFHREKTPSFHVRPADQIFKCFGCGAKGDVISFVMQAGRLDFASAVRELAARAGLAPEFADPAAAAAVHRDVERRKGLFWLTSKALQYFEETLWKESGPDAPAAAAARDYLLGRGFTPETVRAWRLGWAPERWDGFIRFLTAEIADGARRTQLLQYALAAGLVRRAAGDRDGASSAAAGGDARAAAGTNRAPDRYYDFFRGRVMFPILDAQFRAIGFGGRLLEEKPNAGGKYVNSAEGRLFEKRKVLFGLAQAAKEIGLVREALVVEGYVDVIMCHQHGVRHAVATLGTALTEDHLRLLRRHLPAGGRIVALFDADAAGERATRAATQLCMKEDLSLALVRGLPHKDAGAFLPREGAEAFRARLGAAEDAFSYLLKTTVGATSDRDIGARAAAVAEAMAVVNLSPDKIKRAYMRKAVAAEAGVPEATLPDYQPPAARAGGGGAPGFAPATPAPSGARSPSAPGRTSASAMARRARSADGSGRGAGAYPGSSRTSGGGLPEYGGAAGGYGGAPGTVDLALRARVEGRRKRYLRLLHHMWATREWCARVADRMPPDQIWDAACWQVAKLIRDSWLEGVQPTARDLLARVTEPGADQVVADLATGSDDLPPSSGELEELLARFERERGEERMKELQDELQRAQREGDDARAGEVLAALAALTATLRNG